MNLLTIFVNICKYKLQNHLTLEISHLILILLIVIYFTSHSFFLYPSVKDFFIEKLHFSFKLYRIVFNLFAIMGLVLIYMYSNTISDTLWLDSDITRLFGVLVILSGVYFTYKSFHNYDIKEFIGITAESTDTLQNNLVVDGLHKYMRHPVYTATIIIFIGLFIYTPNAIFLIYLITTVLYLQIGIHLEEKKLISKFGDIYVVYKKEVPKLIPRFITKQS